MKTAKKLLSLLLCVCMVMTCVGFGNAYAEDDPPAHTHVYGEPDWEWAGDYSTATATFACTEGDDVQTETDEAPVMNEVSAADCENDQVVTYTATVEFEGVEYKKTTEEVTLADTATGHTYGELTWEWADDYSTATAMFTCTEGDDVQTEIDEAPVMNEVSAADCENDQVVTYTATVEFEGVEYKKTTEEVTLIDTATGHSYDEGTVVEPTCTEKGYTKYACANCGDEYYRDFVDALGHDYGDWYESNAVSCTDAGEERRDCSRCDAFETRAVIPAGHDFGEWTVTTQPGCLTEGQETRQCNNCDVTETKTIAEFGHDYKAETTAATCTEDGYTTYTCTRCTEETEGHSYTDNEVAALGHSYDAVTTEATCTEDGYTTYTCSRCGDTYTANEVDALGHSYEAVTSDPTCTEDGYTTYTCSRCGDTYTANKVVALGHSYDAETTSATCTNDGETTYTCSRCGFKNEELTEILPKLGHSYKAVTTDPTCTTTGITTFTCTRCDEETEGHTYTANEVPALGHHYEVDISSKDTSNLGADGWYWQDSEGEHKYLPATTLRPETHRFTCTRCHAATRTPDVTVGEAKKTHNTPDDQIKDLGLYDLYTGQKITDIEAMKKSGGSIYPVGYEYVVCMDPDCNSGDVSIAPIEKYSAMNETLQNILDDLKQKYKTEKVKNENGDLVSIENPTTSKYIRISRYVVDNDDAWKYVAGTATCYFSGYEENTRTFINQDGSKVVVTTYRTREEKKMMPEHSFVWIADNASTHTRKCTVCEQAGANVVDVEGVENSVLTEDHHYSEWIYDNDETFFKNGHETRTCTDCGFKDTREVVGSSRLRQIIGEILGASVFLAWIYTGISFALAKWFGVTDAYLTDPPAFLRNK